MSKAARQQSARERMRAERSRQQVRERTMRRLLIAGAAVVVVALVVGIGIFVQTNRAEGGGEFAGKLPPAEVSGGNVAMAKSGVTKPVVDIYEDFRCPHCKELEERSGAVFKRLVANGEAKVVYHPVAVIDSGSILAGAASLCAAEKGSFMPYHDLLFDKQSAAKLDVATLTDYAGEVGIDTSGFGSCVRQHEDEIRQNTKKASQQPGFQGTPTVYVNGKMIPSQVTYNPGALQEAILSAGK